MFNKQCSFREFSLESALNVDMPWRFAQDDRSLGAHVNDRSLSWLGISQRAQVSSGHYMDLNRSFLRQSVQGQAVTP
jgi:hypothetical protein